MRVECVEKEGFKACKLARYTATCVDSASSTFLSTQRGLACLISVRDLLLSKYTGTCWNLCFPVVASVHEEDWLVTISIRV